MIPEFVHGTARAIRHVFTPYPARDIPEGRMVDLPGRGRAFVTELVYGATRLRGRYDPIVARGAGRDLADMVAERKAEFPGEADLIVLDIMMPELDGFLHYRMVDVSSIKELCRRWQPTIYKGFQKRAMHTALADIHESIDELKYYREHFLIPAAPDAAAAE